MNNVQDIIVKIHELKTKFDGIKSEVPLDNLIVTINNKSKSYIDIIKEMITNSSLVDEIRPTSIVVNNHNVSPVQIRSHSSVNDFVNKCSGATIDGKRLKWSIGSKSYYYDPFSDKLTVSADE